MLRQNKNWSLQLAEDQQKGETSRVTIRGKRRRIRTSVLYVKSPDFPSIRRRLKKGILLYESRQEQKACLLTSFGKFCWEDVFSSE